MKTYIIINNLAYLPRIINIVLSCKYLIIFEIILLLGKQDFYIFRDGAPSKKQLSIVSGYAPTEHRIILFENVQKLPYTRSPLLDRFLLQVIKVISILYCTHIVISFATTTKASWVNIDIMNSDHPSSDALPGKPLIVCLHWNL